MSPFASFAAGAAGSSVAARPARPWSVLLADDHPILREGVALLVDQQPDLQVVAQARGGREAVQMAQEHQPDVLVLDVAMPDLAGPEVAEQIRIASPRTRVLALTRHADQGYLRRMLRAGAAGYLVKRAAADALVTAIRTVAEGGTYIDPSMAGALLVRASGRQQPAADGTRRPRPPMSEREEQVLRLIAWGKSNKEVASQLGISVKTAEFYKAAALEKLQLRSRTDILRYALAERWLIEDEGPD